MQQVSPRTLTEAYRIVEQDLLHSLKGMKVNSSLNLPGIGFFKKQQKTKVSTLPNESYGKSYNYYQISFRMSDLLKKALVK
jgi:hypothetical protein